MNAYHSRTYSLRYDPLDQQVEFVGTLRLSGDAEIDAVLTFLCSIHDQINGALRLSFRRLRYINAEGMRALSRFIDYARRHDQLTLKIVASGVLAWSVHLLPNLRALWDRIEFVVHDQHFYGSQSLIEDQAFIPLLRNQTRILWPHERPILARHGLTKHLRVADICCGCGDVPLLIAREFQPSFILGVDHSEPSISYARSLRNEFATANADFLRGDATALLIDDESFDFVSCRLSLQIFSQPEQILRELIRITRPGGRIYVTGEDYDLIVGYPEEAAIRTTYQRAADYGAQMGMDLQNGKKLPAMLQAAQLEDIRVDHLVVDTFNTDREAFAAVIESWREFSAFTIGDALNLTPEAKSTLLAGYDAQLRTIRRPQGYTTWTTIACSGRKPDRSAQE